MYHRQDRATFCWASKVILDCFAFALLRSVIGSENSRHSLSTNHQSDAKLKSIATWSPASSRALGNLFVFNMSCHCGLRRFFIFLLICRCDHFGVVFTTTTPSNNRSLPTLNYKLLIPSWIPRHHSLFRYLFKVAFVVIWHGRKCFIQNLLIVLINSTLTCSSLSLVHCKRKHMK